MAFPGGLRPRTFSPSQHYPSLTTPSHSPLFASLSSPQQLAADKEYQVLIEYCTGCRWNLRAFWMAQELLTTFVDDTHLQAVSLIASSTSGQFTISCYKRDSDAVILWDRKTEGAFPEMKQVKQLLRDCVSPSRYLGHSDTTERKLQTIGNNEKDSSMDVAEKDSGSAAMSESTTEKEVPSAFVLPNLRLPSPPTESQASSPMLPHIAIVYCTGCQWLFRAAWYAQEFLQTFAEERPCLWLVPSRPSVSQTGGGTFQIYLQDALLWDRAKQGGFPEIKVIKQLLRDKLCPAKDLGHVDGASRASALPFELMDDDDAEEARRMFGVL
jgi:selenoprotein W-related protein